MELDADPTKLTSAARSLTKSAHAIEAELHGLAQAATVLASAWEGEAQIAFQREFSKYHHHATANLKQLIASALALKETARQYETTDDKGAAALPG